MRYHFYLFGCFVVLACVQDGYALGGVKNLSDISGVRGAYFREEAFALLEKRVERVLTFKAALQNRLGQTFSIGELGHWCATLGEELSLLMAGSICQIQHNCAAQPMEFDKIAVASKVASFVTQAWRDDQGQNQLPMDVRGNALSLDDCVQRLASYFTPVAKGLSGEPQQFKNLLKAAEARLRGTSAVVMPDALYTVAKQHIGIRSRRAFVSTVVADYDNKYQHDVVWVQTNARALTDAQNYPKSGTPKYDVREAWIKNDSTVNRVIGGPRNPNLTDFRRTTWDRWKPDGERWRGLLGHVIAQTQSGVDNCDFYVDGQLKTEPFKINYAALFDRYIRHELEQLTVFPAAPAGRRIDGLIRQKNWNQGAFFVRLKNTSLIPEAEMRNVLYYITQQPNAQDLWDGVNAAIGSNFGACADAKRGSWDDAKRFLALDQVQKKNAGSDQRKHITLLLLKRFFEETLRQNYAQEFPREREALEACLFLSNNVAGLIPYFSFIKQNSPACGDLNNHFLPENLFKIFLPSAPSVLLDYLSRNDAWNDLIKETPRVQMALNLDPDLMSKCFNQNHTAFMPEAPVGDMVINFPEVEAKRQMVNELIKLGILEKA